MPGPAVTQPTRPPPPPPPPPPPHPPPPPPRPPRLPPPPRPRPPPLPRNRRTLPTTRGQASRLPQCVCAFESSSARRLAGAGLFPVDEQEAARRVELRLARSRQDLQLQLFDLVFGAIPAREREVAVASRA